MDERQEKLFYFFKTAIDAEKSSQALYREALEVCDDIEIKQLLTGFLRDEERHEKTIVEKYKEWRERVGID